MKTFVIFSATWLGAIFGLLLLYWVAEVIVGGPDALGLFLYAPVVVFATSAGAAAVAGMITKRKE